MAEDSGATAHCLRCDQKISVKLPMPVKVWCAAMKAFCSLHRGCKAAAK